MDLLAILAATGVPHTEHSQTPFYLVGGALAVFAVIVGVLGIVRPSLGGAAMNAVMGIGVLLVAATMVTIVAVS